MNDKQGIIFHTCSPQKIDWGVKFGDTATLSQYEDPVTINDGIDAVSNGQNSAATEHTPHSCLNQLIRVAIHCRCCLIHHQYLWSSTPQKKGKRKTTQMWDATVRNTSAKWNHVHRFLWVMIDLLRSDRARQSSWRCPTLKFSPFSAIKLSMPLSRHPIFLLRCTLAMASLISTSVCCWKGSKFSLTVPRNSTGSCNTIIVS